MDGFAIEVDGARTEIRAVLSGFWTLEIAERYEQERHSVFEKATRGGARSDTLVSLTDVSAMVPQSQDVISVMKRISTTYAGRTRRSAIVVSSALTRMQASRVAMTDDTARVFSDFGEAEDWLRSPT